jgi:methylglutaconyl-CoA hydratase
LNYESIKLTLDGDHVARLTLARPDIQNAMSMKLVQELRHALRVIAASNTLRAVVLTAELFYEFDTLPKVLVGRINGAATGGGFGMTCICDVTVASSAARFSLTEAKLGLLPANIGPYVARRLGLARARRYGLTAKFIDAAQAERIGLVDRVVEPDELDSAVEEELALILAIPAGSIASTKKLFNDVIGRPPRDCMDYTAAALADAWETENASEGIAAFLGKRSPSWKVKRG